MIDLHQLQKEENNARQDRVFSPDDFRNDVNLHKLRELRAKDVYTNVVEKMKQNPESSMLEFFKDAENKRAFEEWLLLQLFVVFR